MCEGEGQLNAKSCLLQGPSHSRWNKGARVRMEIPDNVTCSLFPGQVKVLKTVVHVCGVYLYTSHLQTDYIKLKTCIINLV